MFVFIEVSAGMSISIHACDHNKIIQLAINFTRKQSFWMEKVKLEEEKLDIQRNLH